MPLVSSKIDPEDGGNLFNSSVDVNIQDCVMDDIAEASALRCCVHMPRLCFCGIASVV
jgi:hypothetical protein